ncbi:MAG: hypothetical protein WC058_09235 [Phycisphaeraceae bacterium]
MTLLELMLAVAGVAMVGLATTALLAGAANAWDSRDQFSDQIQAMRTLSHQLQQMVYGGRRIVSAHTPGTGSRYTDLVLWTDDDQFPGEVNFSELTVLTWDSQLKTLTLHRADLTTAQKQSQVSNPAFVAAAVGAANFGSSFRAASGVRAYPLADRVTGFTVTVTNGSLGSPNFRNVFIKMTTQTSVGATSRIVTICATVRAPDTTVDFGTGGG